MKEFEETCCCGARIVIRCDGLAGAPANRVDEFRAAHAECRRAWALRQGWVSAKDAGVDFEELPELSGGGR